MGAGLSTNLYRIGGEPNQIKFFKLHFFEFLFIRNTDSDKINGKYVVADPLTQLKLIK